MKRDTIHTGRATVTVACWDSPGRRELHAVIIPDPELCPSAAACLEACDAAVVQLAGDYGLEPVMTRLHLSDFVNQAGDVAGRVAVGQPPLCRAKAAMVAILTEGAAVTRHGNLTVAERGKAYTDYWFSYTAPARLAPRKAIVSAFRELEDLLRERGLSVAADCHRTWLWIRDIDATYRNVVLGRNTVFQTLGLWPDTHFIASTGIGADAPSPQIPLRFDAVATGGLTTGQVTYIKAPGHLNDTMDYGVAFERATAIDYGDRRVVYVSGTASIDSAGRIVAPGDITAQTHRMCDNVGALLAAAAVSASDLMHIILYVRDPADAAAASAIVAERFPGVPCLEVQAAVCRPGWLVEMECMAMAPRQSEYAPY